MQGIVAFVIEGEVAFGVECCRLGEIGVQTRPDERAKARGEMGCDRRCGFG